MLAAEMPAGATPERAPDWHSIEWKNVWRAWFKSRLDLSDKIERPFILIGRS
jgi:hypothetical protein